MTQPIIEIKGLGKKYRIGAKREEYLSLRDELAKLTTRLTAPVSRLFTARNLQLTTHDSPEDFWALKDVSFSVQQGEAVGIIGRNGAGKSTLLKILSQITPPTEGEITVRGRVASLLEVGTGFHGELTGRENIFLNGAILGMTRSEIRRRFDEIVAFSEVEQFLDTPVKRYSSGMYVRLAFAVAAHLEPEILVVDEVLAVGDASFQKKCLGKMGDVAKQGRTVLFVSHNMEAVSCLTRRAVLLSAGKVIEVDETTRVVKQYLASSRDTQSGSRHELDFYRRDSSSDTPVRITSLEVEHESDSVPSIEMGADFTLVIGLDVRNELRGACVNVILNDSEGRRIVVLFSWDSDFVLNLSPGMRSIAMSVQSLPLTPGEYSATLGINQSTQTTSFDLLVDVPLFTVINNGYVTQWTERPWGTLHWNDVTWSG